MRKVVKLTESDLEKIVKRVISEQEEERKFTKAIQKFLNSKKYLPLIPNSKKWQKNF